MASESGYSNQKKYGTPQFKTIQGVGSDKFGVNTAQMYLYDISPAPIAIVSVTQDPLEPKKVFLEITAHGAKEKDILRMIGGTLEGWEFEIVEVVDANNLVIWNLAPSLPIAAEQVKSCRWVTAKSDSEGALQTTSGPIQFIKDGATVSVNEDTIVSANNVPLPV